MEILSGRKRSLVMPQTGGCALLIKYPRIITLNATQCAPLVAYKNVLGELFYHV
jgi:hypothetical protein